jgi:hypothetical protein
VSDECLNLVAVAANCFNLLQLIEDLLVCPGQSGNQMYFRLGFETDQFCCRIFSAWIPA